MSAQVQAIPELVQEIMTIQGWSREELAAKIGVSGSAVARWATGRAAPRPHVEGQLRTLARTIREDRARYSTAPQIRLDLGGEAELRAAIDGALCELREIFHRRSRLAGRSEALDEVTKLLFAHVLGLANEQRGISSDLLRGDLSNDPAVALERFVHNSFKKYLPESLAHEIRLDDFRLRIKPQEAELAKEIIYCFDILGKTSGLVSENGIEAVDLLNEVFGKFLADSFVDEKQLGQYLTPTEVVRFMVQLAIADMTPSELDSLLSPDRCQQYGYILDPSCGVASFLAECIRALHSKLTKEDNAEELWLNAIIRRTIVGVDKSERMLRYALTNIAMFGIPATHLRLRNALSRHDKDGMNSFNGKVGLILTNPPFGAEFSVADSAGYKISTHVTSEKLSSECLFVERYLDWLRPGGQLLAIVPDSVLTNKGVFAALRKQLESSIEIRNVISLPQSAFAASGTTTKTSILHIRKLDGIAKKGSRESMVSICNDMGYEIVTRNTHRVKKTIGDGQLPVILENIRMNDPDGITSKWVPELEKCSRWDANFYMAVSEDQEKSLHAAAENGIQVRDVAYLSGERQDPRRGVGNFSYIEISNVDGETATCIAKQVARSDAPSRARKVVRAGDVLVSTVRPERKTIGVVSKDLDGAICTTGFAVLRPTGISPLVLASLLRSSICTAQLLRHNVGIAYPAIDEKCLADIWLPIDRRRLDELTVVAQEVAACQEELSDKWLKFSEMLDAAKTTH